MALDIDGDGVVTDAEYEAAGIAPPSARPSVKGGMQFKASAALRSFRRAVGAMATVNNMA